MFLFNNYNEASCALCWTVCGNSSKCCSVALQPLGVALALRTELFVFGKFTSTIEIKMSSGSESIAVKCE